MTPIPKPAPHKPVVKKARARAVSAEKKAKQQVRDLDGGCRFPLCGCRGTGIPLDVAHVQHKGMGSRLGRAKVNVVSNMLLLCHHRHQLGRISIHRGTLKMTPATEAGTRGLMVWTIDTRPLGYEWGALEEVRIVEGTALQPFAVDLLERLAKMDV